MRNPAFQGLVASAILTVIGGTALVLGFGTVDAAAPTPSAAITCADARRPINNVPTPTVIDATCAVIPTDFVGIGDTEPPLDIYSWLTFIAVNWPVNPACAPLTAANILTSPPNPTWMTYLSSDDVFVAAPSTPSPWCSSTIVSGRSRPAAQLPARVQALARTYFSSHPSGKLMYLHHDSKGHALAATLRLQAALGVHNTRLTTGAAGIDPNVLNSILDATNQPVVDQNGRFERFTISMNVDEYKYIMKQKLWTFKGEAATGNLSFPTSKTPGATIGAMEFKAGWKVLVPKRDDFSHFFTMPAVVYNDAAGSGPPEYVTVGLVALHITHKTPRQSSWIWTTFEQIDNTNDGPKNANPKSFYNPACAPAKCPPNVQTAPTPYIEIGPNGKRNAPTQIVPFVTPAPTTVAINSKFRGLLKNTPWSYYQLVATQWVGGSVRPPSPNPGHLGGVQPALLGNAVMETYVPPTSPGMSSTYSCMYCHSLFMQGYYQNFTSDFSLLVNAQQ
ncbi:MAG TPA: hypothetical protein VGC72_04995 [Candidatus Elarobacter sp.]|jgi:hypothetical protein